MSKGKKKGRGKKGKGRRGEPTAVNVAAPAGRSKQYGCGIKYQTGKAWRSLPGKRPLVYLQTEKIYLSDKPHRKATQKNQSISCQVK